MPNAPNGLVAKTGPTLQISSKPDPCVETSRGHQEGRGSASRPGLGTLRSFSGRRPLAVESSRMDVGSVGSVRVQTGSTIPGVICCQCKVVDVERIWGLRRSTK